MVPNDDRKSVNIYKISTVVHVYHLNLTKQCTCLGYRHTASNTVLVQTPLVFIKRYITGTQHRRHKKLFYRHTASNTVLVQTP